MTPTTPEESGNGARKPPKAVLDSLLKQAVSGSRAADEHVTLFDLAYMLSRSTDEHHTALTSNNARFNCGDTPASATEIAELGEYLRKMPPRPYGTNMLLISNPASHILNATNVNHASLFLTLDSATALNVHESGRSHLHAHQPEAHPLEYSKSLLAALAQMLPLHGISQFTIRAHDTSRGDALPPHKNIYSITVPRADRMKLLALHDKILHHPDVTQREPSHATSAQTTLLFRDLAKLLEHSADHHAFTETISAADHKDAIWPKYAVSLRKPEFFTSTPPEPAGYLRDKTDPRCVTIRMRLNPHMLQTNVTKLLSSPQDTERYYTSAVAHPVRAWLKAQGVHHAVVGLERIAAPGSAHTPKPDSCLLRITVPANDLQAQIALAGLARGIEQAISTLSHGTGRG